MSIISIVILRCDGVQDCESGEDEKNCATCTFADDMCGWSPSSDYFLWERVLPNTPPGSLPNTDHLNGTGHIVKLKVNAGGVDTNISQFRTNELGPFAPACALEFR